MKEIIIMMSGSYFFAQEKGKPYIYRLGKKGTLLEKFQEQFELSLGDHVDFKESGGVVVSNRITQVQEVDRAIKDSFYRLLGNHMGLKG